MFAYMYPALLKGRQFVTDLVYKRLYFAEICSDSKKLPLTVYISHMNKLKEL